MYGFFEPPPSPPPRPGQDREPPKPTSTEQTRPTPSGPKAWNLHLESAGTNLPVTFFDGSPSAAVLAVEDLCWEAAVEDWKHRRPPRWRFRARFAWEDEGVWLAAKADHLRHLADEILQEL